MSIAHFLPSIGDGSDNPIAIDISDSLDAPMIPTSATWSLYDQNGTVVNSRLNVPVASMASTIVIPVTALDNIWGGTVDRGSCKRFLKVDIVYTNAYVTDGHYVDWWQWEVTKEP